jgi:hypothetical protein
MLGLPSGFSHYGCTIKTSNETERKKSGGKKWEERRRKVNKGITEILMLTASPIQAAPGGYFPGDKAAGMWSRPLHIPLRGVIVLLCLNCCCIAQKAITAQPTDFFIRTCVGLKVTRPVKQTQTTSVLRSRVPRTARCLFNDTYASNSEQTSTSLHSYCVHFQSCRLNTIKRA